MNRWNHLTIYPENSSPYFYPVEALLYKEGLLFQLIRDWSDRGFEVEIVLAGKFSSPIYETFSVQNQS